MRQEFDGDADLYDRVVAAGNIQDDPPDGLIYHCAAVIGDKVRVHDVWRSQEDFDRFVQDRLGPAFEQVAPGRMGQGTPPETWELHNTIDGR
jgi:hypothetical protein